MARASQTTRPTSTVEQAPDRCLECGGRVEQDQAAAEAVCTECGLVHEADTVDLGPEWRALDDDADEASRVGAPVTATRHDKGLTTTIGAGNTETDARGETLSPRQRNRAKRLKWQQGKTVRASKTERNATYALTEIKRLVAALEVPDVVHERACEVFQKAQDQGLMTGRDLDAFTAAGVYAGCRENGCPVVRADVLEYARCDHGRLMLAYGVLNRELDLSAAPFTPSEHVPRVVDGLGLEPEAVETVAEVAKAAEDAGLHSGRSPSGLAGGAVYYALGGRRDVTQAAIGDVVDVTPKTVRDAVAALEECDAVPDV